MNTQAIAQHLNIIDSAITEIQEWASVLWVKFIGGVRFVSKKIGAKKMVNEAPPTYKGRELYADHAIWVSVDNRKWELATIGEVRGDLINFNELPFIFNYKTEQAYLWGEKIDTASFKVGRPYEFKSSNA
jgi:hypothetical protein